MIMDLDQLETLVAVSEEGGITAAAMRRNLSQPAVSLQMKRLEGELGVEILARKGRGVVLTGAGEALLGHARQALMAVRSARAEVAEILGVERGSLRLGTTDAAGMGILPAAFFEFHHRYPGIEVEVEVESTGTLLEGLRQGHLDLALGTLPVEDPSITSRVLQTECLGLVAPADAKGIPLTRLLGEQPFIAYPRGSTTRELVDRALEAAGLHARPVMEIGRPAVMARLVEAGLGVSVLPESTTTGREGIHRVSQRRFTVNRDLGLLQLTQRNLEPAARAFIQVIEGLSG
jgi:DNA-binding transcriptional LysR family regulator